MPSVIKPPQIYSAAIKAARGEENHARANMLLAEALKHYPDNPFFLMPAAQQAMREGEKGGGRVCFEHARSYLCAILLPDNIALTLLARVHMHLGDHAKAEKTLLPLLAKEPGSDKLHDLYGRALLEQEKFPQAHDFYKTCHAKWPHIKQIGGNYCRSLIGLGNGTEAEKLAREMIAADANDFRARRMLIQALTLQGGDRVPEAERLAREMIAADPDDFRAKGMLIQALTLQGGDRLPEAEKLAREMIAANINVTYARGMLCQALTLQGGDRLPEAERLAREMIAADPDDFRAKGMLIQALTLQGGDRLPEAEKLAREMIAANINVTYARGMLCQALTLQGGDRLPEAERLAREMIAADPDDFRAKGMLIQALTLQGGDRLPEAEKLAREMIAANINVTYARGMLCQALTLQGGDRLPEAERLAREMIAADANDFRARRMLIQALTLQGGDRLPEAEKLAREMIAADANDFRARRMLIQALALQGGDRLPEAERLAREMIATDPDDFRAKGMLCQILVKITRRPSGKYRVPELALAAQSLLDTHPDNQIAHMYLGVACHLQGDMDSAVRHLKKAIELSPKGYAPRMKLAGVYLAAGRKQDALAAFVEVIAIKPDILALQVVGRIAANDAALQADYRLLLAANPQLSKTLAAQPAPTISDEALIDELVFSDHDSLLPAYIMGSMNASTRDVTGIAGIDSKVRPPGAKCSRPAKHIG